MDPELSRLIDFATNIAASGRWEAVTRRLDSLAQNPAKENVWWIRLVACLCHQVFSEYLLLKRAYEGEPEHGVALLAWRARNLLELSIWCLYCAKSRENARRFFEDAGRDVNQIFEAFTKWGTETAQDTEWLTNIADTRQERSQQAAAVGISSVDGSYKRVEEAAVECGIGNHFRVSNRMLSKFAHPTAMQILGIPDEAQLALQRDHFFSDGCLFFTGAFEALEGQLM